MTKPIKITKITIILLISLFILILFYQNTKPFGETVKYPRIINEENKLTPYDRVSEVKTEKETKYQEALDALIYTDLLIDNNINDEILLRIRFKNNLPENSKIDIGIKDKEEWHYNQQT